MPDDDKKLPVASASPSIPIIKRHRWVCGSLGFLLVVYASVVIWRGREGLGTVALIVLAGVLLILAVAGVVPRRIKAGDNEVEMWRQEAQEAVRDTTDAAIATMTADELEAFKSDVIRQAGQGDPTGVKAATASRAQEASDYEKRIENYLAAGLPPGGFQKASADEGVDFVAINGVTKVGIDAQLEFNTRKPWLWRAWLKIEQKQLDAVVIVVQGFTDVAEANLWLHQHAEGSRIAICNDDPATVVWLVNHFLGRKQAPTHINTVIASAAPLETG